MKLNSENAFLGAKVKYNNKEYYVVKINTKTCYLSQKNNFLKRWKNSEMKWKDFCKKHNAEMVKYELIEISSGEVARKEKFLAVEKQKQYLSSTERNELKEILSRIKWNYKNPKYKKTYKYTVELARGKFYRVLKASYKNGWVLFNINNEYVFLDLFEKKWIPYNKNIHKNNELTRIIKNREKIAV